MVNENITVESRTETLRGFAQNPFGVALAPVSAGGTTVYVRNSYLWPAVIAGALYIFAVFTFSYFLMLGCRVGVTAEGFVQLGAGSAVWLVVTACVAGFLGGVLSSGISQAHTGSQSFIERRMHGAVLWALSVPLNLCIWAAISGGAMWLGGMNLFRLRPTIDVANIVVPGVVYPSISFGFVWAVAIGILLGGVFCVLGSLLAPRVIEKVEVRHSEPHS